MAPYFAPVFSKNSFVKFQIFGNQQFFASKIQVCLLAEKGGGGGGGGGGLRFWSEAS